MQEANAAFLQPEPNTKVALWSQEINFTAEESWDRNLWHFLLIYGRGWVPQTHLLSFQHPFYMKKEMVAAALKHSVPM